jgi:integrase
VFHSWRHFYAARLADITDLAKVQRVIGHKTAAMTEHYAAHIEQKQLDEMASVSRFAFKGILRMAG